MKIHPTKYTGFYMIEHETEYWLCTDKGDEFPFFHKKPTDQDLDIFRDAVVVFSV